MERESIVDSALNAYTLAECKAAEKQLREWLQAHPQDLGLHEIAGSLGIAKMAAIERESGRVKPLQIPEPLVAAK